MFEFFETNVHLSQVVEGDWDANKHDDSHDNHCNQHGFCRRAESLHTSRVLRVRKVGKHEEEKDAVQHDDRNRNRLNVKSMHDSF